MNNKIHELFLTNKLLIKEIQSISNKTTTLCISRIVFSILYPLIVSVVPKIIIDNIQNHIGIPTLILKTLIVSIIIAGISWINPCVHEKLATKSEIIRINYQHKLLSALLNTDYEKLICRNEFEKAKVFVEGSGKAPVFDYCYVVCDLFISVIGLISCVIIMSKNNFILLFVFLASIIIEYFFNRIHFSNIRKMNDSMFEANIKSDYIFRKSLTTNIVRDALVFNSVNSIKQKSQKHSKTIIQALLYNNKVNTLLKYKKLFFTVFRDIIIYTILIKTITSGKQDVSDFVLYFGLINIMTKWINTFYIAFSDLSYIVLVYNDYNRFIKKTDSASKNSNNDFNTFESLYLKDVCYKYGEKLVLNNINLNLKAGQKIAIVGTNGSGKSTLANILCGLFKPCSGEIYINNQKKSFEEYSTIIESNISVLFQSDNLLPEKFYSNISLKACYNEEQLETALVKTNLLEKIASLHKGFNTYLVSSVNYGAPDFSGGETQRILMSRCFYNKRIINLFDEPTASLDVKSESNIYDAITKEKELSIVISHRIANIMKSDLIIVMNEGRIVESGNHSDLIKKRGTYYELYHIQQMFFKK